VKPTPQSRRQGHVRVVEALTEIPVRREARTWIDSCFAALKETVG
jgi:hypothetical protein